MTKDELIDHMKKMPGDARILINNSECISKGSYQLYDSIMFFPEMSDEKIPTIMLIIDNERGLDK